MSTTNLHETSGERKQISGYRVQTTISEGIRLEDHAYSVFWEFITDKVSGPSGKEMLL